EDTGPTAGPAEHGPSALHPWQAGCCGVVILRTDSPVELALERLRGAAANLFVRLCVGATGGGEGIGGIENPACPGRIYIGDGIGWDNAGQAAAIAEGDFVDVAIVRDLAEIDRAESQRQSGRSVFIIKFTG